MSRKWCLVQRGASYQFSPETMSGVPSRLMSATAQVSFEPRSRVCFSNAISGVRTMLHAARAAASNRTTAREYRVMRTILPLLLAAAAAQGAYARSEGSHGFPEPDPFGQGPVIM